MNSLDRYTATLANRGVDHLARIPILMQFAARHINASFGDFCRDYRVKTEANIRCAEDFHLDLVGVMSDPYSETQGFGADITYHDDATPECRNLPLGEQKNLDAMPTPHPSPHQAQRMANTLQAIGAYKARVGGDKSILGWVEGPLAEAADLRGVQQMMVDLYDDASWCQELMDRCVEVAIEYARAQVEAGADTIGVGDALASQISPDLYETLVQPREQRLVQAIRDMGAYARMHICGNITHLLPGLAELPLNVLDVDHMVDLPTVRKAMPADVALGCNIDPVSVVLQGTPQIIRQAVRQRYQSVGNPFLVNAGCEIPPDTPPENLRALCQPVTYES